MTFINETISPEDKVKYNIGKLEGSHWTRDKELDMAFLAVSIDRHHNAICKFIWKGTDIKVLANLLSKDAESKPYPWVIYIWDNVKVELPENLSKKKQEILCSLKEALCVGGEYTILEM